MNIPEPMMQPTIIDTPLNRVIDRCMRIPPPALSPSSLSTAVESVLDFVAINNFRLYIKVTELNFSLFSKWRQNRYATQKKQNQNQNCKRLETLEAEFANCY
jgi:hypothetical protein